MQKLKILALLCLVLCSLLISASVFYYLVIYIPRQAQMKLELEKSNAEQKQKVLQAQKDQQKQDLQDCLDRAENNYHFDCASACRTLDIKGACGLPSYFCSKDFNGINTDCLLPTDTAHSLDNEMQQDKSNCFKQ